MATNYPIILAHGICRFDHLLSVTFSRDNKQEDGLHYFRHIRSTLMAAGFEAYHTSVAWAAGVKTRADQLRTQIEQLTKGFKKHAKVHIIAHSMGGLDARHMIFAYQMADRVASLSTIGTPHLGSSFADWGVERHGWTLPYLKMVGIDAGGFLDLTSESCKAFNREARAFERTNGVKYQTFTGIQPRERIFLPLRLPYDIIYDHEGENDGLVSLRSAKWTDQAFVRSIDADHLNEIGWCDVSEPEFARRRVQFERRIQRFYLDIAEGL